MARIVAIKQRDLPLHFEEALLEVSSSEVILSLISAQQTSDAL